ncbi:TetR/AcrR family transcriptional regulator C-terminal domain-containing protein [Adlercreutzia sp. R21]|uniref:TetR/AcrR family transcriptional regulator C-terminal domain-containing protein n=1 Tax=Adlercreutzia wanghongyangiae TaxID=3111451 RepID=UPI002DB62F56|nr:TetR/AcrR family transcriptional regulator C-terminal domain-containing protein [Adlercreutzia sp. R21]MEC4184521.1 TetR/AcrR family transcriptional regulator C-terminal domain-containing protein [Adlercreutzia sp. R21]
MEAFKRIVAEKPIDKVTVAELVRETGLSRQAFYNHFLDKYDLSIQIYEQSFAPVAQGHRDRITTWLESGIQHLEIYAADKDYYRNVLSSYDRSSLRFYLKDRMYHEFRHKCELRGAVFDTEDKVYALKMVVFATNEMTFEWVENGCQEPAEVIVKRFDLCRPMILSPYLEDTDSVANPCTDTPPRR